MRDAPPGDGHDVDGKAVTVSSRTGIPHNRAAGVLLRYLISQAYIPEHQVRWSWKPNSIAIWDNRSTQHYAVMDYPPCHRKMERAGIKGDAPF